MAQYHAGLAKHGQAYFALHQLAGKGQRGRTWNALPHENITISVVIYPDFPNNRYPFLLSAVVSLACIDLLNDLRIPDFTIKWPNDIYWCDRKAGGILIENVYRTNEWKASIVGIGLNINQTEFPTQETIPVSLKQITGTDNDPIELAKLLCLKLNERYNQLLEGDQVAILKEYNSMLFKKGEQVKLKKGNIVFETTIEGVTIMGELQTRDTIDRTFVFGEVEWVLV